MFADRTGDPRLIAHAQHMVTVTDCVFTLGGIVLIYGGGFGAALVAGLDPFEPGWLLWGQLLFAVSGVIWLGVLVPAQIRRPGDRGNVVAATIFATLNPNTGGGKLGPDGTVALRNNVANPALTADDPILANAFDHTVPPAPKRVAPCPTLARSS